MKRITGIFAAAVLLAVAPPAFAQGFGIKGGLTWNDVSNSGVLPGELQRHTGFAIGLDRDDRRAILRRDRRSLRAARSRQ